MWQKVNDYCVEHKSGAARVVKIYTAMGWRYEIWMKEGDTWKQQEMYETPEEAKEVAAGMVS